MATTPTVPQGPLSQGGSGTRSLDCDEGAMNDIKPLGYYSIFSH